MQLPLTSNSLLFWMDPSEKYVLRDASNNLISITERLSGAPISGTGTKPSWLDGVINGHPALTFNGTQRLTFNLDPRIPINGIAKKVMVSFVQKVASFPSNAGNGSSPFDLGSSVLSNPGFIIQLGAGAAVIQSERIDDLINADFGAAKVLDNNFHVITLIFDGTNLLLRKDGIQIDSVATTNTKNNKLTIDQIALGDWTDATVNSFGHAYMNGKLGMLLVYSGGTFTPDVETFLQQYYNL